MQIILANESHFAALLGLFKELDHYHVPLSPDRIKNYSENSRSYAQLKDYVEGNDRASFLAEINNEYIGFINIRVESVVGTHLQVERKFCLLDNAYVKDPYRRQGVSSKLMAAVQHWCRERSIAKLELQVFSGNSDALDFYRAMGFEFFMHRMELNLDEQPR